VNHYCENAVRWISSLSGFQGGNPSSEIWFCGIEYQEDDLSIIDKPFVWYSVSNPPSLVSYDYVKLEHGGQEFNKCICKIAESYYGDDEQIINPFNKNGKLFKLNLYSLPQKATGEVFTEEIFFKTRIRTKSEVRALSIYTGVKDIPSRFDNFKTLLNNYKNNVKVIVCCSREAINEFLIAFGKPEEFYRCRHELKENEISISKSGNKNNYISWCNLESGQKLFVIPFLGGRNPSFKSSTNMKIVGDKIREVTKSN
jgi:hypothetical protein